MITECRSCKSKNIVDVADFGEQYLSEFRTDDKKPDKYPLKLVLCNNCTLVQLKSSTPPEKLYTDNYGYRSGINEAIKEDLKDVIKEASTYVKLELGDVVVDIGANDFTLISYHDAGLIRVGYEPVTKFVKEFGDIADYAINDFFSADKYPKIEKAKMITFISCFYDLEDPNKVVDDLANILADDGVLVIEQNYLARMLTRNAFDNIVHEHIEYYTLTSMEHLLNRHGLEVVGMKETSINGGAFRLYIKHMNILDRYRLMEKKMKLDNKWTYMLFSLRVRSVKNRALKFVNEQVNKGKKIYLYGASTRSGSMLQYIGLDHNLITAAIERNPEKWGTKIASLGIPIISEAQARKEKPDFMILGPWYFQDVFKKREEEYLKNGGKFIVLLPEFKIIEYDVQLERR